MSAFYFGSPQRQLFGYLHTPQGSATGGVLLCPPWGAEYQYAHRALHFLAKRLSGRGFVVLRFDYSGTGDSWGDSTDADLSQWVDDTTLAAGELRAASGLDRLDLVGLRVGAGIAAQAVAKLDGVRRLVVWDPITDGDRWLNGHGVADADQDEATVEVSGSLVSSDFVRQYRSIGGNMLDRGTVDKMLVLVTQRDAWNRDILPEGGGVERELIEQPASWVEEESIWTGQIPVDAVGRIVEWLT